MAALIPVTLRRGLLLVPLMLVALMAVGVWWAYANPPLGVDMSTRCCNDRPGGILGLDFVNKGRWSLRLTNVTVDGEPGAYQAEALVSTTAEMASSAAVRAIVWDKPDKPHPRTGPVAGWAVEPSRLGRPYPHHGLRLTWGPGTDAPRSVTIQYRYLMIPMKLVVNNERWP